MSKHDKPEKKDKDEKPYLVFRYCKKQCFACNECGYFWGPGAPEGIQGQPARWTMEKPLYTAESVKARLAPKWDAYFAKLAAGQAPNWKCDKRAAELWCLSQWIMDELMTLKCPDDDRKQQQRFFNRKSRATDDLYPLAADTINGFLTGNIDQYRGRG